MNLHELSTSTRIGYKEDFLHNLFFTSYELALQIARSAESEAFAWVENINPTYTISHNVDFQPIVQLTKVANYESVFKAYENTCVRDSQENSVFGFCTIYSVPSKFHADYSSMCKEFSKIGCELIAIDLIVGKKSIIAFCFNELKIKKIFGNDVRSVLYSQKSCFDVLETDLFSNDDTTMVSVKIPINKEFFINP